MCFQIIQIRYGRVTETINNNSILTYKNNNTLRKYKTTYSKIYIV